MNQVAKSSDKTENDKVNMRYAEQFWLNPNSTPSTPPIPPVLYILTISGKKLCEYASYKPGNDID